MKFAYQSGKSVAVWLPIISGPLLALLTFYVSYTFDPLSQENMRGITAFYFSVVVLMIGQWFVTVLEGQKTSENSKRLYDAVKNYLHVTTVGSPENAIEYIAGRLPALREVQNTSLNTEDESERSDEKLYQSGSYEKLCAEIPLHCREGLIWKDVGDIRAVKRLRSTYAASLGSNTRNSRYKYKLLTHSEPQINFILLEYRDGSKEVLFNWDFRGLGQDPTVLISRDPRIIEMFSIQFNLLWRSATEDHDSQATKSTSIK